VREIAELWNISYDTVRRMFLIEPGVLDVSANPQGRTTRYKRSHRTIMIPESVLVRVYKRRQNPAA
jgi:hypothetical protein